MTKFKLNTLRPLSPMQAQVASVHEAELLSDFVNAAYRGDSSRIGWTTEADLLDGQRIDPTMLREQIASPDNVILLFRDGAQLIACVFLQRRENCAYLGMFTVAPALQGSGIGKKVLGFIEDWVVTHWSVRCIEMCVISKRKELVEWYLRRGYSDTGRREPFPYGEPKYGLPKVADLEMMVLEKHLARRFHRPDSSRQARPSRRRRVTSVAIPFD